MSSLEDSEQVMLDYWYTDSFIRLMLTPDSDFESKFKGKLSKWLQSQGRDVHKVLGYNPAGDKIQNYFVITYETLDGSKKYLRLPTSFECLRGKGDMNRE